MILYSAGVFIERGESIYLSLLAQYLITVLMLIIFLCHYSGGRGLVRVLGLLEQRVPGELPASGIWGADQASGEMGRTVGAAVEMGAVAARLPVEQPPRRMIPGHQLVVEEQVAGHRSQLNQNS
jgi:hypothetical protein